MQGLCSIPRRVALHALNVGGAVRRASGALAFPDHFSQAVHRRVMRFVQRVAPGRQQFDGLADAAWLVNRALLADGQVHRQVQKRVRFAAVHVIHFFQRRFNVGKIGVVFGVLVYPQAREGFQCFERLARAGFGIDGAKKAPDIGLRGRKHPKSVARGPI
jgi:hypothetical protein